MISRLREGEFFPLLAGWAFRVTGTVFCDRCRGSRGVGVVAPQAWLSAVVAGVPRVKILPPQSKNDPSATHHRISLHNGKLNSNGASAPFPELSRCVFGLNKKIYKTLSNQKTETKTYQSRKFGNPCVGHVRARGVPAHMPHQ